VVVPVLNLINLQPIVLTVYSVVLVEAFFRKAPESFEPIDVVAASPKCLLVINPTVFPKPAQAPVALEAARVKHGAFLCFLFDLLHERSCGNVGTAAV